MSEAVLRNDIAIEVDGCPAGWVAAVWNPLEASLTFEVMTSLAVLIDRHPSVAIGVDIPIGLSNSGPRACDIATRRLLGPGRASSVFPAPCRGILNLNLGYAATSTRSKMLIDRGISQQTYHIIPKIAEVDALITPELQRRVIEVHPEVSFWALAGGEPMRHAKKRLAGFNERRDHLRRVFPYEAIPETRPAAKALVTESKQHGRGAGAADVLDAIVAAWSAHRFAVGEANQIPPSPEVDARGLTMAITY